MKITLHISLSVYYSRFTYWFCDNSASVHLSMTVIVNNHAKEISFYFHKIYRSSSTMTVENGTIGQWVSVFSMLAASCLLYSRKCAFMYYTLWHIQEWEFSLHFDENELEYFNLRLLEKASANKSPLDSHHRFSEKKIEKNITFGDLDDINCT